MQIDKHYANTPAAMLVILGGWCGATRKAFRTINPVTSLKEVSQSPRAHITSS